jgi:prophage antirepressor-like protein
MTHELTIFQHPEFGIIRTMRDADGAWLCGKDFCRMCGDSNPARSLARLDNDEKRVFCIETPGGMQETTFVNEPGSYNLIFSMQPQKANSAKGDTDAYHPEIQARIELLARIKRWVTHEILPSIRKHGGYLTPAKVEEILSDPDTLIRLATDIKNERAARIAAEARETALIEVNTALTEDNRAKAAKIEEDAPIVERHRKLSEQRTAIDCGEAATILQAEGRNCGGRNTLLRFLVGHGMACPSDEGYRATQHGVKLGYTQTMYKEWPHHSKSTGATTIRISCKAGVTVIKGMDWLRTMFPIPADPPAPKGYIPKTTRR